MFELSQLRCFVAVATELNFRKAASRLNMTQPPLSRQIQLLEHQLGIVLLERNNHSVRLTVAGRAFFQEAQALLEQARQASISVQKLARGETGNIEMSFVSSAMYALLPNLIVNLRNQYPEIHISLKEMNSAAQLDALDTQRIDCGIVRSLSGRQGLSCECLVNEPFALAIPAGHQLAQVEHLSVQDLNHEDFIMYSYSGWRPFYELLTGAFQSAGVTPNYVQLIHTTQTIVSLVNAGLGIALVPQSTASLKFENVVFRPIELGAGVCSSLYLVWRQENDNPAFHRIRDSILKEYQIHQHATINYLSFPNTL